MSVQIKGIERVAGKLAFAVIKPAIETACVAVAAEVHNEVAEYPRRSGRRRKMALTAKQRRLVFAKIRAGQIPYKRTGNLGQRWQIIKGNMSAVLSNNSGYARYVYGVPQARYHSGWWPNIRTAVIEVRKRANAIFDEALRAALQEVL